LLVEHPAGAEFSVHTQTVSTRETSEPPMATSRVAMTVAGITSLLSLGALALFVYPWAIYLFG
jgi:hypothetical protein